MEELQNYINGEWVSGRTRIENINPSDTRDVINLCSQGSAEDVDAAVMAARSAFTVWRDASPQVRHDLLDSIGNALLLRKDEVGAMLSREEGKTLAEGVGETLRAGQRFKFWILFDPASTSRLSGSLSASLA